MKGCFTNFIFLTEPRYRHTLFLTLFVFVLCPFQSLLASDYTSDLSPGAANWSNAIDAPVAASDQRHRIGLLINYIRKEGPGWAPGLPSALRDPQSWALNGLRNLEDAVGFGAASEEDDKIKRGMFGSILTPMSSLTYQPTPEETQALWFSPGYHHKGFLPIDDTMVMGFSMREEFLKNRVRLEMHPYYGQNLISQRGYYGSTAAVDFRAKIGPLQGGRIAVGYVNGDNALMENGHGFDLHSELRFSDHLSLNAGVRESEQTQLGNYVMMRWKVFSY